MIRTCEKHYVHDEMKCPICRIAELEGENERLRGDLGRNKSYLSDRNEELNAAVMTLREDNEVLRELLNDLNRRLGRSVGALTTEGKGDE